MTSASLKLPAGLDAVGDGWFPLTATIGCWLLPPQPMRTRAQASAGATTNVRVRVRLASPSGPDPIKAVTEASAPLRRQPHGRSFNLARDGTRHGMWGRTARLQMANAVI